MVLHVRAEATPLRAGNFSSGSGKGVFQQNRPIAVVHEQLRRPGAHGSPLQVSYKEQHMLIYRGLRCWKRT